MKTNVVVLEDAMFNINKALAVGILMVGDPDADPHVCNAAALICDELKRAADTITAVMGLSDARTPAKSRAARRKAVRQPLPLAPLVADAAQMQHD